MKDHNIIAIPNIQSTMFTTMDPKLMCPTLTIMLTKTIKALCEVNIKFEKNLEICGSLHVRSDGEKVLTCVIDEESIRPSIGAMLQPRNTPETALAQQSAVMALLTASQQMAANRSPGLASPPMRNFTPTSATMQATDMSNRHSEAPSAHLQHTPARNTHNAVSLSSHDASAPGSVHNSSPQEVRSMELHRLPPVNSLIQNREVLLGMLQDKSRNRHDRNHKSETHSSGKHQYHTANSHLTNVKEEPSEHSHTHESHTPIPNILPQTPSTTANGSLPPNLTPITALPNLPNPFPVLVNAGAGWPPNIPATPPMKSPRTDAESPPQDPEIVTTINSKGQKKFQCMFCGILLSTKNYLKNHINAVHTKARVYPCEICERYFYSAGALRIHKLRHHWAGSKKHKCAHCHDSFLLPVELRRHLGKKHGDTSGAVTDNDDIPMKENTRGTSNLTIEQLRQLQLQEHVRAQQQLIEHEQALSQLQGEPLELSMRSDEQPEPGEITNDTMHSQMTVIVQPEPPPDVTHMELGEMHPNQNEVGIPDDDIEEEDDDDEEIRDDTPREVHSKQRLQSHSDFVPQPTPAIEIGNNIA